MVAMVTGKKSNSGVFLRFFFVLVLLAATAFLLQQTGEVRPVAIRKSLASFPHTIGPWQLAKTFQSSSDVLELLGVDDYIQYNYISPSNEMINLYAGYYRAVGVEGGYHSPKNCIPGGGWGIDSIDSVVLDTGLGGRRFSTVSQMIIRRGKEFQVVLYWFQNRGRIIASEYWEKFYLVWDALFMGRRDGTFVRIIMFARDGDIAATKDKAKRFAESVMVELAEYLPGEKL